MTQILSFRQLIAASGFATVAAVSLIGQSGQASASVEDCRGRSGNDVMKCCQDEVSEHGRPDWMRTAHVNCNSASVVVCKASGGSRWRPVGAAAAAPGGIKKCKIAILLKPVDRDSHDNTPDDNTKDGGNNPNGGRGPTGRDTSGNKPF
jgi:hypothetical protein